MRKRFLPFLFILSILLLSGCLSSSKNQENQYNPDTLSKPSLLLSTKEQGVADDSLAPEGIELKEPVQTPMEKGVPVDEVSVQVDEKAKTAVVTVKGNLPDACSGLAEPTTQVKEDTFYVHIGYNESQGDICAQVLTPYEKQIQLEVKDLPPGTYFVNVNGEVQTFSL